MLAFNKKYLRILTILWIISLCLPGIANSGDSMPLLGILILAGGWIGPFNGIFSWYSILFAMSARQSLIHKNGSLVNYKSATIFSGISILLLLQALLFEGKKISYIDSNGDFGDLSIGYYLYLLVLLGLFLLSMYNWHVASNNSIVGDDISEN